MQERGPVAHGGRVVGLSRKARPEPLLKMVNRKRVAEARPERPKPAEERPWDAPPESTDDEEGGTPLANPQPGDSSDDDRTDRAAIRKVDFGGAPRSQQQRPEGRGAGGAVEDEGGAPGGAAGTRRSARQARQGSGSATPGQPKRAAGQDGSEDSDTDGSRPPKKTKPDERQAPRESFGSHLQKDMFGPGAGSRRRSARPVTTYKGKRDAVRAADSPERPRTSYQGRKPPSTPPKSRLKIPAGGLRLQATPKSARERFKRPEADAFSSPAKPEPARFKPAGAEGTRQGSPEEEATQKAVFRLPKGYDALERDYGLEDHDGDGGGVDLHGDLGQEDQEEEATTAETEAPASPPAACPMCNEPVDRDLLASFSSKSRMSIGQQSRFCRLHKTRSAEAEWRARGYPAIAWDRLESRIAGHRAFLQGLIEGGPSRSAEELERRIRAGKGRTLLTTEESLTPGYYGLRGLRAMTEAVIGHFSGLLRSRAVRDRLISARGHTSYVQAVLVPELCVRLIGEDMGVGEEAARGVLRDSRGLGDLLHDDKGDTVHQAGEEEEEEEEEAGEGAAVGRERHGAGSGPRKEGGGDGDGDGDGDDDDDESDLSSLPEL